MHTFHLRIVKSFFILVYYLIDFQHFISWIEDIDLDDINIVNCGKDDPTLGKINIISYDLASKLVGKIYRKQFKIIVAVSTFVCVVYYYSVILLY